MPSYLHESLVLLFRYQPRLAPRLLRHGLRVGVPSFSEGWIESADLTDVQPAEYRADLVLRFNRKSASGARTRSMYVIVEVQLSKSQRKRFAWPAYVANLHARVRCPVYLLVITADERVARWAAKPIDMGGGNVFTPLVLRPSNVPRVRNQKEASRNPELAVLSVMSHARSKDADTSVRIALLAQKALKDLEPERSRLYYDLIVLYLRDAAKKAVKTMDVKAFMRNYRFQSPELRRIQLKGIAQGQMRGRAAVVLMQLNERYGTVSREIRNRIAKASESEIDAVAKRLLTARTLKGALAPLH